MITLIEAKKLFESRFKEVVPTTATDRDKDHNMVWSGGVTTSDSVAPALWLEGMAVETWLVTALSQIPLKCYKLEWILNPELIKYQITMADVRQQQRLVSDRYTVRSQFIAKSL